MYCKKHWKSKATTYVSKGTSTEKHPLFEEEVIQCYKPVQVKVCRMLNGTVITIVPDKSMLCGLHVLDNEGYLVNWTGTNHLNSDTLSALKEEMLNEEDDD